ncbi:MAG: FAD-dependent oxidoreductase [Candidatus Brocadiae bacterium]|nr:FAD-dependent oxidoreductase [Candidatus Brocadiia bacterium]
MTKPTESFREEKHEADFCVVGGGLAGLCAALSAARHGAKVVLMQDRPVLGGNASGEIRVHICGADRHNSIKNMRETGILEELRLENLCRNPNKNYSVWDTILYERALYQENLTLLLNCSCTDAEMDGDRIASVSGWQLTTQTHHKVSAAIFADCSGDGILAPLTGAEFRVGREARSEYGESIAPEEADSRTMGMTCHFQARQYETPQPFDPPSWAHRFTDCDEMPYGENGHRWWTQGYWWIELGGECDSIHDTERLRDELLKITYGVWDHIKNRCRHRAEAANWALDWIQFLPGKRESRRYIGDHVLTQLDVETGGRFDDTVAYGGWTMDDHHPAGFWSVKIGAPATIFHPAASPYGIPYRALYSKNVANLMFAGRVASCTHAAMSSARVMGTCSSMGQAVGTAAAVATRQGLLPRDMNGRLHALQQALLKDDCYLPGVVQEFSRVTRDARLSASRGDPEPLRDGINRPVGDDLHCWQCRPGDHVAYEFDRPEPIERITLILDSALDKNIQMSHHQKDDQLTSPPDVLPRGFRVEGLTGGNWTELARVKNNCQRLVRLPIGRRLDAVRFVLDGTWGAKETKVYAFYLL